MGSGALCGGGGLAQGCSEIHEMGDERVKVKVKTGKDCRVV